MSHEIVNPDVLHPDYFKTPFGDDLLAHFASQVADYSPTVNSDDLPEMVVAIQSYAHSPEHIRSLGYDIRQQHYPADKVHTILLSTENSGETLRAADNIGMEIMGIAPRESLRADYLNAAASEAARLGVSAFISTVGHAALSNRHFLQVAAGHTASALTKTETVAYGVALPKGGTNSERFGARFLGAAAQLRQNVKRITGAGIGVMASDCAVWSVQAVKELGGFDEGYGLGGADGDMAKRMLHDGVHIYQDALLSAHVTKDLGPISSLRQLILWRSLSKPHNFDPKKFQGWHPHGGL